MYFSFAMLLSTILALLVRRLRFCVQFLDLAPAGHFCVFFYFGFLWTLTSSTVINFILAWYFILNCSSSLQASTLLCNYSAYSPPEQTKQPPNKYHKNIRTKTAWTHVCIVCIACVDTMASLVRAEVPRSSDWSSRRFSETSTFSYTHATGVRRSVEAVT